MHLVPELTLNVWISIYIFQLPNTLTTEVIKGSSSVNSQRFLGKGGNLGTLKISVFLKIGVFLI